MSNTVKRPVDLTDKLAKKHGSLAPKSVSIRRNDIHSGGTHFDYFYIFSLTFSFLVMVSEPLFIFIGQFI
jgi:hypothetical protein